MLHVKVKMDRLTTYLFSLILIELAVGGGGRLFAFGPVTLRMILFGLALLCSSIYLLQRRKLKKEYIVLLIAFSCLTLIGILRGIDAGAARASWFEDVKPLLYFFILPFFSLVTGISRLSANIIKAAGIFLSLSFILILVLIHSGIISFLNFYHAVIGTGEFFFRGELTFFYKGFLFLCIAFLFFHFSGKQYRAIWMTIIGVAIVLTVTRGFWFALCATYAVFYFSRSKLQPFIFAFLAISVLFMGQYAISQTSQVIHRLRAETNDSQKSVLLGDRLYSDDGRITQAKEVMRQTTIETTLIGHGLGIGIPSRPTHMEISYLEIFHKQGLLGLAFWFFVFWQLVRKYQMSRKDGFSQAFFLSGLLVFIQSLTNQYINNPIGLSIVLLSIVCLDVSEKKDSCYNL